MNVDAQTQIDASASYDINKRITLFVEGTNLNNSTYSTHGRFSNQTLDVFSNPVAERLVRALPPYAVVFGVTTEHCVRLAALGLRRLGIQTAVVSDAVRALGPDSGRAALDEMRQAGVEFTTTEALLEAYAA